MLVLFNAFYLYYIITALSSYSDVDVEYSCLQQLHWTQYYGCSSYGLTKFHVIIKSIKFLLINPKMIFLMALIDIFPLLASGNEFYIVVEVVERDGNKKV